MVEEGCDILVIEERDWLVRLKLNFLWEALEKACERVTMAHLKT